MEAKPSTHVRLYMIDVVMTHIFYIPVDVQTILSNPCALFDMSGACDGGECVHSLEQRMIECK